MTEERTSPVLIQEALMWVVIAVGIFLFISYFGFGGFLGTVVSDVSFGVFGWPAYLFPFLLIVSAAFLISNRGSKIAGVKFLSAVGLYLTVCSFFGLAQAEASSALTVSELYERSAAGKSGGGAVGGGICSLLCPALGVVGSGVFLSIFAIICVVLMTQRSILRGVGQQGRKVYASAKESSARRREALEQERRYQKEVSEDLQQERKPELMTGAGPEIEREFVPFAGSRDAERSGRKTSSHSSHWTMNTDRLPKAETGEMRSRTRDDGKPAAGRGKRSVGGAKDKAEERTGGRAGTTEMKQVPEGITVDGTDVRTHRTELEIPSIFPSTPQQSRYSRKVSGMTSNTIITGRPETLGAEVREILPGTAGGLQQEGFERTDKGLREIFPDHEAESELTFGSEAPEKETTYIDLDRMETEDEGNGYLDYEPETQKYAAVSPAETMALHIEGISGESKDTEEQENQRAERNSRTRGDSKLQEEPTARLQERADRAKSWADDVFAPENGLDNTSSGHTFRASGIETSAKEEGLSNPAASAKGKDSAKQEASVKPETHEGTIRHNPRSSKEEIQEGIADVEAEMEKAAEAVRKEYIFPPMELLKRGTNRSGVSQEQEVRQTAAKLQKTLDSFGVHAKVTNVSCGPSVTRYELMPEQGVKVKQIVGLSDDIKLNLAAADIRIEAPIPGKSAVGIEVPNSENSTVMLRDLLETPEFEKHKSNLAFAVGKDIGGKTVVADIAKMPHLLIAGATGSGKSVCINTLIMSILYKAKPEDVKLIMIDPKVVELSVYNGIPHLFIPVVTDPKKAAGALNWAVAEMTDRYNKFAEYGVRDLKGYNQKIEALKDIEDANKPQKLPQIVIIVDELADLMMVAPGEVEDSICRLAQLARAAGLHLIIATQRPSVNVITGLIKANMPSRIAFSVSSGIDSRTIIDMYGAEKLLGKGDMLFYPQGYQKPARVQGAFVSDEEVSDVVDFLKEKNMDGAYTTKMEAQMAQVQQAGGSMHGAEDVDALFAEAGKFIIEKDKASIGMLQRVFKIGFNRAARIMDQLSDAGVVGPEEGTKPRKILMSEEEFENYLEQN